MTGHSTCHIGLAFDFICYCSEKWQALQTQKLQLTGWTIPCYRAGAAQSFSRSWEAEQSPRPHRILFAGTQAPRIGGTEGLAIWRGPPQSLLWWLWWFPPGREPQFPLALRRLSSCHLWERVSPPRREVDGGERRRVVELGFTNTSVLAPVGLPPTPSQGRRHEFWCAARSLHPQDVFANLL